MKNYEEYAILEAQIEVLEQQKEKLREKILSDMIESGEKKKETAVGTFSVSARKTWKYPKTVEELNEKLKEEKARAESTGEATYTETESLRFNKLKL